MPVKKVVRSVAEKIDSFALAALPVQLTPGWTKLLRGQYAGDNALMYLRASYWLKLNRVAGDVLEFGVGSGASFCVLNRYLARVDAEHARRFFLFDSFQGLPPGEERDQHPQWQVGAWAFSEAAVLERGRRYGVDLSAVKLVPGFFSESLSAERARALDLKQVALLHIDCDLYSSTEQALEFVVPFVTDGTVVLLDDYYCYSGDATQGEAGAFHAWCARHRIVANDWFPYSLHGRAFLLTRS